MGIGGGHFRSQTRAGAEIDGRQVRSTGDGCPARVAPREADGIEVGESRRGRDSGRAAARSRG